MVESRIIRVFEKTIYILFDADEGKVVELSVNGVSVPVDCCVFDGGRYRVKIDSDHRAFWSTPNPLKKWWQFWKSDIYKEYHAYISL